MIDARMSPLERQNYAMLMQWLGQPSRQRLAPIAGDAVSIDLILAGQRIFGGVRFVSPTLDASALVPAAVLPFGGLANLVVGYLGGTGEGGWLGFLDRLIVSPTDDAGYSQSPRGLWRRKIDGFTVFSLQRQTLDAVTPQLRYEEAPRPAQIRIRTADLSQAQITPFVNNWGFSQTRDTSLGNISLMQQVSQQFHIPGNAAKDTAEHLLDARLVDPLGGQYVYRQTPAGAAYWTSTDVSLGREGPPEGYWALAPELVPGTRPGRSSGAGRALRARPDRYANAGEEVSLVVSNSVNGDQASERPGQSADQVWCCRFSVPRTGSLIGALPRAG